MPFDLDELRRLIESLVTVHNESNAGVSKVAIGEAGDEDHRAIVVVDAGNDTQAVLEAVEQIEESWHLPSSPVPQPENIGDIYKATGYLWAENVQYGAISRIDNPSDSRRWIWAIEMDDGDVFPWDEDVDGGPDLMGAKLELYRRNPLPGRKNIEGTKRE